MRHFYAHCLIFLAAWTVVIKYLFPMAYASAEGSPLLTYVLPDAWPVAHVAVAWSLLHWQRWTWTFALVVALVEIAIVTTKFMWFLAAPEWTIWRTNWFINKIFVLTLFTLMLGWLLRGGERLRRSSPDAPER